MDVRRIRPLVPPPYPRRNRYTPSSSEQSPFRSASAPDLRSAAKAALHYLAPPLRSANASLVCESILGKFSWSKVHFVPLSRRTCGRPQKLHSITLLLLFAPQTLRWFVNRSWGQFSRRKVCSKSAKGTASAPCPCGCWKVQDR